MSFVLCPPYIRLYFKVLLIFISLSFFTFLTSAFHDTSNASELNNLKNSLKKGKITSDNDINSNFSSTEIKILTYQTSEIKLSEQNNKKNIKTNSNLPSKNSKNIINKNNKSAKSSGKPSRINDTAVAATRISESVEEPGKYSPVKLPDDKELLSIDSSETKLWLISKIKEMHNAFSGESYYDYEQSMNDVVNYGSNYPDLCALAKLYYAEYLISQTKSAKYEDDAAAYFLAADDLEKDLKIKSMLEEIAAIYKQGPADKYGVCNTVSEAISKQGGLLDRINAA